ncbi:MAG: AarF/ABC1/UbiB kinase family protein [Bacteroidetes bacterium]|nr:AarF/ABC1/UbiB kinase family protein [Bacteroidota bacterium]
MIASIPEKSRIFKKEGEFEPYLTPKPVSTGRRFLYTIRNLIGLALDGSKEYLSYRKKEHLPKKFKFRLLSFAVFCLTVFKSKRYANKPFGVQLRSRLSDMGATYIKLGQILALRSDLLPRSITDELALLFDKLTVIDYDQFEQLVEENLNMPVSVVFNKIVTTPLASASIAQVHLATLKNGEDVVIKLLKPGTRELILTDSKIIRRVGSFLEYFIPRTQPKKMLNEFCEYTSKEVNFKLEADNAIEFANNFSKHSTVVFPKIYRQYSNENMIVMEFLKGVKPDAYAQKEDVTEEMRAKVADIGAFAIIKMIYNDGFFHADLHPGNLLILDENKCAFIDLGMVGRFSEATRKNLLYYFNALVLGNSEAAARYMTLVAKPGRKADIQGFRKEFVEVVKAYQKNASFNEFSVGKLIMVTTELGAKYDMYYPMELILMSKAMVTFEGVGEMVKPGLDIVEVSKKHVRRLLIHEVNPKELMKASLQNAPEFIDTFTRGPGLFVEVLNRLEQELNAKPHNKMDGIKGVILAGFFILSAAIVYGTGGAIAVYVALFTIGIVLALKS